MANNNLYATQLGLRYTDNNLQLDSINQHTAELKRKRLQDRADEKRQKLARDQSYLQSITGTNNRNTYNTGIDGEHGIQGQIHDWTAADMQQGLSDMIDAQVYTRDDGSKYQIDYMLDANGISQGSREVDYNQMNLKYNTSDLRNLYIDNTSNIDPITKEPLEYKLGLANTAQGGFAARYAPKGTVLADGSIKDYDGAPGEAGVTVGDGALLDISLPSDMATKFEYDVHRTTGQIKNRSIGLGSVSSEDAELYGSGKTEYTTDQAPMWNIDYKDPVAGETLPYGTPTPVVPYGFNKDGTVQDGWNDDRYRKQSFLGTVANTAKAFGTSFVKELFVDTADFIGEVTTLYNLGNEAYKTKMVNDWMGYDPTSSDEAMAKVSMLSTMLYDEFKAGKGVNYEMIADGVWTSFKNLEMLGTSFGAIMAWLAPGAILTKGGKVAQTYRKIDESVSAGKKTVFAGSIEKAGIAFGSKAGLTNTLKSQSGQIAAALGNVNDQYEAFVVNNNGVELEGSAKLEWMAKSFGIQMFNQNLDALTAISVIKTPGLISGARDAIKNVSEKAFGEFTYNVGKTLASTAFIAMPKEAAQEYTQEMMEMYNERYGSEQFKDLDTFTKFALDKRQAVDGITGAIAGAGGGAQFASVGAAKSAIVGGANSDFAGNLFDKIKDVATDVKSTVTGEPVDPAAPTLDGDDKNLENDIHDIQNTYDQSPLEAFKKSRGLKARIAVMEEGEKKEYLKSLKAGIDTRLIAPYIKKASQDVSNSDYTAINEMIKGAEPEEVNRILRDIFLNTSSREDLEKITKGKFKEYALKRGMSEKEYDQHQTDIEGYWSLAENMADAAKQVAIGGFGLDDDRKGYLDYYKGMISADTVKERGAYAEKLTDFAVVQQQKSNNLKKLLKATEQEAVDNVNTFMNGYNTSGSQITEIEAYAIALAAANKISTESYNKYVRNNLDALAFYKKNHNLTVNGEKKYIKAQYSSQDIDGKHGGAFESNIDEGVLSVANDKFPEIETNYSITHLERAQKEGIIDTDLVFGNKDENGRYSPNQANIVKATAQMIEAGIPKTKAGVMDVYSLIDGEIDMMTTLLGRDTETVDVKKQSGTTGVGMSDAEKDAEQKAYDDSVAEENKKSTSGIKSPTSVVPSDPIIIDSNQTGLEYALTNPTHTSPGGYKWSPPRGDKETRDKLSAGIDYNGKHYADVEQAYQDPSNKNATERETIDKSANYALMIDLIEIKLRTFPGLVTAINAKGGIDYLNRIVHQPSKKNSIWQSNYVGPNAEIEGDRYKKALIEAYGRVSTSKTVVPNDPVVVENEVPFDENRDVIPDAPEDSDYRDGRRKYTKSSGKERVALEDIETTADLTEAQREAEDIAYNNKLDIKRRNNAIDYMKKEADVLLDELAEAKKTIRESQKAIKDKKKRDADIKAKKKRMDEIRAELKKSLKDTGEDSKFNKADKVFEQEIAELKAERKNSDMTTKEYDSAYRTAAAKMTKSKFSRIDKMIELVSTGLSRFTKVVREYIKDLKQLKKEIDALEALNEADKDLTSKAGKEKVREARDRKDNIYSELDMINQSVKQPRKERAELYEISDLIKTRLKNIRRKFFGKDLKSSYAAKRIDPENTLGNPSLTEQTISYSETVLDEDGKVVKDSDGNPLTVKKTMKRKSNIKKIIKLKNSSDSLLSVVPIDHVSDPLQNTLTLSLTKKTAKSIAKTFKNPTEFENTFYLGENPSMSLLFNRDGSVNMNTAAAVAVVAEDAMANGAESYAFNDDRAIERYYGIPEENITRSIRRWLGRGIPIKYAASELGLMVLSHLGYKIDEASANELEAQSLVAGLGAAVLYSLMNDGRVLAVDESNKIDTKLIRRLQGHKVDTEDMSESKQIVVMLSNPNAYKGLSINAKNKIEALETEIGIESEYKRTYRTKTKKIDTDNLEVKNNPYTDVYQKLKDVVSKYTNQEYKVDMAGFDMMEKVGKDQLKTILGYRNIEDMKAGRLESFDDIEAQVGLNFQAETEVDEMFDVVEKIRSGEMDNTMYFNWFVSKTNRLFMDSNTINPQIFKHIQRFLIHPKEAIGIVDVRNEDHLYNFKYAVAQSMGYAVDKKSTKDIEKYADLVLAIDADILEESIVSAMKNPKFDKRTNITISGSEVNVKIEHLSHMFAGIAAARSFQSQVDGKFETSITMEVDGLTNGFGIKIAQGLEKSNLWGPKVGINDADSASMNDILATGDQTDSYQEIGKHLPNAKKAISDGLVSIDAEIRKEVETLVDTDINEKIELLEISKDLLEPLKWMFPENVMLDNIVTKDIRNLIKPPFMVINYNAGVRSIKRKLGEEISKGFSNRVLAGIAADKMPADVKSILDVLGINRDEYSDFADQLISTNRDKINIDVIGDTKINLNDLLLSVVEHTYGNLITKSLMNKLEKSIKLGNMMNDASKYQMRMFVELYNAEVAKAGTKLSITKKELLAKSLIDIFPAMAGPLSEKHQDGVAIFAKQLVSASETDEFNRGSDKDSARPSNISIKLSADNTVNTDGEKSHKSMLIPLLEKQFAEAMSASAVGQIQTEDGAGIAYVMDKNDGITPIFDATQTGVFSATKVTRDGNQGFYELNKDHNIFDISIKAFERSMNAYITKANELLKPKDADENWHALDIIVENNADGALDSTNGKSIMHEIYVNGKKTRAPLGPIELVEQMKEKLVEVNANRSKIYDNDNISIGQFVFKKESNYVPSKDKSVNADLDKVRSEIDDILNNCKV